MKLLFLLYDFYPHFGANSIIINDLAGVFTESGHEVHILPLKASPEAAKEEQWNRLHIHRITQTFDKPQLKTHLYEHRFISAIKLAAALLKDKHCRKEYLSPSWSYFSYKRFRDILKKDQIDIVINVCYPFEASNPVMKYIKRYEKTFCWIIYMQDPFATNYYYLAKYPREELLQLQTEVFRKADKIVVTYPIMNELSEMLKEDEREKYKVLNFPKVKKLYRQFTGDDIVFDRHYINCVFVGRFNKETRNPTFLFRLFAGLRKEPFRLHIIGEELENWREYLPDASGNIIFHGSKSKEAAVNAELNANILINLANSINNQLPSKLLEYISTGKPIINLYQLVDCPTLNLLKQYPVYININENLTDHYIALRRLRYFIRRNRHVNIGYQHIQRRYYYSTLQYVSCEFLNLFDELMEDTR